MKTVFFQILTEHVNKRKKFFKYININDERFKRKFYKLK